MAFNAWMSVRKYLFQMLKMDLKSNVYLFNYVKDLIKKKNTSIFSTTILLFYLSVSFYDQITHVYITICKSNKYR